VSRPVRTSRCAETSGSTGRIFWRGRIRDARQRPRPGTTRSIG
jgi:hypothetical protein